MFSEFLKREYQSRCEKNKRYSVRSFARTLSMDAGALLRIMNAERKPTASTIRRICDRLNVDPETEKEFLFHSAGFSYEKKTYKRVSDFEISKYWYYFAILELTHTSDFRSDHRWIAKRLGISSTVANMAIEDLLERGLLSHGDDGLVDNFENLSLLPDQESSRAMRAGQKEVLAKASEAIDEVPLDLRDHTSMTLAIEQERIPEIKGIIKEFRRRIDRFAQSSSAKDSVYELSIAFFPWTKNFDNNQLTNMEKKQ